MVLQAPYGSHQGKKATEASLAKETLWTKHCHPPPWLHFQIYTRNCCIFLKPCRFAHSQAPPPYQELHGGCEEGDFFTHTCDIRIQAESRGPLSEHGPIPSNRTSNFFLGKKKKKSYIYIYKEMDKIGDGNAVVRTSLGLLPATPAGHQYLLLSLRGDSPGKGSALMPSKGWWRRGARGHEPARTSGPGPGGKLQGPGDAPAVLTRHRRSRPAPHGAAAAPAAAGDVAGPWRIVGTRLNPLLPGEGTYCGPGLRPRPRGRGSGPSARERNAQNIELSDFKGLFQPRKSGIKLYNECQCALHLLSYWKNNRPTHFGGFRTHGGLVLRKT